jgi:CrcB protein
VDDDTVVPIDPDLDPADPAEPTLARRRVLPRRRHGRAQPDVLGVIALGGMVGATARFEVGRLIRVTPGHFPWATFWVNLSGSVLPGFLLVLLLERFPPTRYLRPFLATGIIGAYTTMSTYLVDTAVLLKDGHLATASLYGIGSVIGGLLAAYVGVAAARLTPGRHHDAREPQEDR